MKKQTLLLSAVMCTLVAVSAQTLPTPGAMPSAGGQLPLPPRMEGKELREDRKELRDQREEIREDRQGLMDKRIQMRASNTEEREDIRKEMQDRMRNATSPEARKQIVGNMQDRARDMRASNTEERKELREENKQIVKERSNAAIERLGLVAGHFENALTRANNFLSARRASSTADFTKVDAALTVAKSSLEKVKSDIKQVESFKDIGVNADNKEAFKNAVKNAQDSIRKLQDDLKNLLNELKSLR